MVGQASVVQGLGYLTNWYCGMIRTRVRPKKLASGKVNFYGETEGSGQSRQGFLMEVVFLLLLEVVLQIRPEEPSNMPY